MAKLGRNTVRWIGVPGVQKQLRLYGDKMLDVLQSHLYLEAELIMTKAKKLTPVDTGALRASGFVEPPRVFGNKVEVTLGFGGPAGGKTADGEDVVVNVGYAVFVHENVGANFTVGQAKFLEQPYLERKKGLPMRLKAALDKVAHTI